MLSAMASMTMGLVLAGDYVDQGKMQVNVWYGGGPGGCCLS